MVWLVQIQCRELINTPNSLYKAVQLQVSNYTLKGALDSKRLARMQPK